MWSNEYHIRRWHYEMVDGKRKRIIDEWIDKRVERRVRTPRHPCIACGAPTLYVYCSVRCVNERPEAIAIVEGRYINGTVVPAEVESQCSNY